MERKWDVLESAGKAVKNIEKNGEKESDETADRREACQYL